ncbi:MAG: histone-like nucleoid-structuring protein Lsr2 [Actinomycetota bacterium]
MKVTLYSSDSLEDALRVVGALYGVSLQVGAADAAATSSPAPASRPRSRGRSAAASGTAPRKRAAARAAVSTPTADLRRWAKAEGYQVNDRGPLPADVVAAHAASR